MLKLDPDERSAIHEIFNHVWMRQNTPQYFDSNSTLFNRPRTSQVSGSPENSGRFASTNTQNTNTNTNTHTNGAITTLNNSANSLVKSIPLPLPSEIVEPTTINPVVQDSEIDTLNSLIVGTISKSYSQKVIEFC